MVNIREGIADRFAVDTSTHVLLKGYVNGNWGEGNIDWLKVYTDDAQKPGEPIKRITTVGGEDYAVDAEQHDELSYGVVEWDPNQIADITTDYATGDLIPVLPFHSNVGMVFQGWVLDTGAGGDAGPDSIFDAGAAGFEPAAGDHRVYAALMYFVADIDETPQHLVLYSLGLGFGG